ncbi:hypothetical protein DOT_0652 [Desulfosporosinus sp. OT]|nr:hypothetical protein DOT_0652 [Desulfosporosinus sp. OT]
MLVSCSCDTILQESVQKPKQYPLRKKQAIPMREQGAGTNQRKAEERYVF